MAHCSRKCSLLVLALVLGLIFLLLGLFGLLVVPKLLHQKIREQTYLAKGNLVFKSFVDPPYDVKLQVWTFSVKNAPMVMEGAKPIVEEKGPYTFDVVLHKTNTSFSKNNTRFLFRNGKTYHFNRSQSCGDCSLTDPITVPNILFQKFVDIAMQSKYYQVVVDALLLHEKEKAFTDVTVDELLFKGYADPLLKHCDSLPFRPICKAFKIPDKIGLFYGQNGTDDGLYEVDTGVRNVDLLDKVYSWNGMDGILGKTFWYNESARMINGTDAELFKPNLFNGENLQIFIGQLCRSFELAKWGTAITSDIPVFRYSQPNSFLDVDVQRSQGFCNQRTAIYFDNQTQQAGCAPSGLLDMSSCLQGNPRIFWSQAHFRGAPPGVRVEGMRAPSGDDFSYFDIEPTTGVVVGVQQKSQLNLGMIRGNLYSTQKMHNLIVPLVWINESAAIDPKTKAQLEVPLLVLYYSFTVGLGLIVAGATLLVCTVGVFIGFKIAERRNRAELELNDDPRTPLVTAEQPTSQTAAVYQQMPLPSSNSNEP